MISIKDKINSGEAKEARENGFVFVCSTCENLHSSNWRITGSCRGVGCFGPLGGGYYNQYIGPLDGIFSKFCFLCGSIEIENVFCVNTNKDILFGVCKKHVSTIREKSFVPLVKGVSVERIETSDANIKIVGCK